MLDEKLKTPPDTCLKCGADMNGARTGPKCNNWVFFNEKIGEWEAEEPMDFKQYFDNFRKKKDEKKLVEEKNPPLHHEDVEF